MRWWGGAFWALLMVHAERSWDVRHYSVEVPETEETESTEPGGEEEEPDTEDEGEENGSIEYKALHARTEDLLQRSKTFQAQVKGPLTDATHVYLEHQERYKQLAHHLHEGEKEQHELIRRMRDNLRKHHQKKMSDLRKVLRGKAPPNIIKEEEDDEDDDEEETDEEQPSHGEAAEEHQGSKEVNEHDGSQPAEDHDTESQPEEQNKEKDTAKAKEHDGSQPTEDHDTESQPEEQNKEKDTAKDKQHDESQPAEVQDQEQESKPAEHEEKSSTAKAGENKGCDARKTAKRGSEDWCRCNTYGELITKLSSCEDSGGGRNNLCKWSSEDRTCLPRKKGKPWK